MLRMIPSVAEAEGDSEVLATVVAGNETYYDSCASPQSSQPVHHEGKLGYRDWKDLRHKSNSLASPWPKYSDSLAQEIEAEHTKSNAYLRAIAAQPIETSALLSDRQHIRARSKKPSVDDPQSVGTLTAEGAVAVGDDEPYCNRIPLANRVLSCLIAMLQGVEVLCNLAILYLYKDDFRLDPAILAIAMGALKVPWTVKPLWALMTDNLPLFGYRRKSYIFIGSFLCIFALLGLGLFGYSSLWTTTLLLFLYFVGSAMCNVIGEALVVEAGRKASSEEGAANSVSAFFAFRKISFAVMSYLSGFLLNYMDKRFIFLLGTCLPLAVFLVNFWMVETRAVVLPLKEQLNRLLEIMRRPVVLNSTLFIFLMMSTPSAGSIMFYYMTNELKFGPELLGRMALFQSIASLLGILAYWWFFSKTNLRKLLLISTLTVTPFCLLPVILVQRWNVQLGIADTAFVVTDTVLMEFVGEIQTMPLLVLGARLCPPGLESSIYSFLLSAYNLGLGVGALLSAGMTAAYGISSTDFTNLTSMIIVCAFTNLLPLGILWLVPDSLGVSGLHASPNLHSKKFFAGSDSEEGTSNFSTCASSDTDIGEKGRRIVVQSFPSSCSDSDSDRRRRLLDEDSNRIAAVRDAAFYDHESEPITRGLRPEDAVAASMESGGSGECVSFSEST